MDNVKGSFGAVMGGGVGMVKAVGAGIGGVQVPLSASTTKPNKPNMANLFSVSSPSSSSPTSVSSSSLNFLISATSVSPTQASSSSTNYCFPDGDERNRESVKNDEDERTTGFSRKYVFGPIPSKAEVEDALSALQQIFSSASYSQLVEGRYPYTPDKDVADQVASQTGLVRRVSSSGSQADWIEPQSYLFNSRMLQSRECRRVYDAFRLLQTEPAIQRMVLSLSSDKALWDAVNNNEVVQELGESSYSGENNSPRSSDASPDMFTFVVSWILDITKAKVIELIEKITKLMNDVLQPSGTENTTSSTDHLDELLRSSVLLSIVVFLIVVVARAHRA